MSNRHPVDELADLRASIKAREKRAEALRDDILAGRCSHVGDEYAASMHDQSKTWIDQTALRRHFGARALAPFVVTRTIAVVRIAERKPEKELD